MDARYRQIYELIYLARTSSEPEPHYLLYLSDRRTSSADPVGGPARHELRSAIEEAQSPPGRGLREDAKALLAVNFQELVMLPLGAGGVSQSEVQQSVASDI